MDQPFQLVELRSFLNCCQHVTKSLNRARKIKFALRVSKVCMRYTLAANAGNTLAGVRDSWSKRRARHRKATTSSTRTRSYCHCMCRSSLSLFIYFIFVFHIVLDKSLSGVKRLKAELFCLTWSCHPHIAQNIDDITGTENIR